MFDPQRIRTWHERAIRETLTAGVHFGRVRIGQKPSLSRLLTAIGGSIQTGEDRLNFCRIPSVARIILGIKQ